MAAKADLGVPRYSGVIDIVRGNPTFTNDKEVTSAPSDVAINMMGEGGVSDTDYARVS